MNFDLSKISKKNLSAILGALIGVVAVIIAIFVFLGSSSGPGINATPQEQFKYGMKKAVSEGALLDKLVGQFHLSDSKTEILKAHYKSMFDDKLLDYYIAQLDAKGVFKSKKPNMKVLMPLVVKLSNEIGQKGITRLTKEDRLAYFVYSEKLPFVLSPNTCKMLVVGNPSLYSQKEFQSSSKKVFKRLSEDELTAYLHAINAASHAEIDNNSQPLVLTKEQKKRATDVFSAQLDKQIASLPQMQQKRIKQAAEQFEEGRAMDVCSYGKQIYKAILSIEDPDDRDLVVLVFLGQ